MTKLDSGISSVVERNESYREIEKYLPPNYPQFLFHGSSADNAITIQEQGLRSGTLSTWVFDCFDERFFRNNGRLLFSPYNPDFFQTVDLESRHPKYQYYILKAGTAQPTEISFVNVDTDNLSSGRTIVSDRLAPAESFGCLSFTKDQKDYLDLVHDMLSGRLVGEFQEQRLERVRLMLRRNNLPDSAAGVAGSGLTHSILSESKVNERDEIDYRVVLRQRRISEIIGIDASAFKDLETLQIALSQRFNSEEVFIHALVQTFPEEFLVEWNNLGTGFPNKALEAIFRQMYQKQIVDGVKDILSGGLGPEWILRFNSNPSTVPLDRLIQERGIEERKRKLAKEKTRKADENRKEIIGSDQKINTEYLGLVEPSDDW